MSGGYFEHKQYAIEDIADTLEEVILNWCSEEQDEQGEDASHQFSGEALMEFLFAFQYLKQAALYIQRIDWLLSGDDAEDSFHKRLAQGREDVVKECTRLSHKVEALLAVKLDKLNKKISARKALVGSTVSLFEKNHAVLANLIDQEDYVGDNLNSDSADLVGQVLGKEFDFDFLTVNQAKDLHRLVVGRYGGGVGVRDNNLLDSAIHRPLQKASYEDNLSIVDVAALTCVAIIQNHPFIDGNKRTGYFVLLEVLDRHGVQFNPDPAEALFAIRGVAAGNIDVQEFTQWVVDNTKENKDG